MPAKPNQPESVLINVSIDKREDRTEFYVMRTPKAFWDALPIKAKFYPTDAPGCDFYIKAFSMTWQRRRCEFTFYRDANPG